MGATLDGESLCVKERLFERFMTAFGDMISSISIEYSTASDRKQRYFEYIINNKILTQNL